MWLATFLVLILALQSRVRSNPYPWLLRQNNCSAFVCCEGTSPPECQVKAVYECSNRRTPSVSRFGEIRISCGQKVACSLVNPMYVTSTVVRLEINGCRIVNPSVPSKLELKLVFNNIGFLKKQVQLGFVSHLEFDDIKKKTKWPSLQSLILSNANLTSIPVAFLSAVSSSLNLLNLSNNKLTVITAKEFSALVRWAPLREIVLDHNNIIDFGQKFVSECLTVEKSSILKFVDRLKPLHVGSSVINALKVFIGTFVASPTLRTILNQDYRMDLFDFKINLLPKYAKQDLRVLRLNYNRLTRIPDSIFGFNNLEELHLAYNNIADKAFTKTEQYVFKLMHKLKVLNLEGNFISKLEADSIVFLENLQEFYIGKNRLSSLPYQLFSKQAHLLTRLDISNNMLPDFRFDARLVSLKTLNIRGNRISYLGRKMLQNMPNLEELDASDNPILAVEEGTFLSLQALLKINMRGHLLPRAPAAAFKMAAKYSFAARVELDFFSKGHAPTLRNLTCDCDSVFLAAAIERKNIFTLQVFHYPHIQPPVNLEAQVCKNILGYYMSYSQIIESTSGSNICSVQDIDCPYHCLCCKSLALNCDCTFHCPIGCKCFRSHSWLNVTLTCKHVSMNSIPTKFASPVSKTLEKPLVTEITFIDADLPTIGFDVDSISASCTRGLLVLQRLTVINSNLRKLHKHVFICTPRLRSLTIVGNPLQVIHPSLFSPKNNQILHINFTNNAIKSLPASAFSALSNLLSLDLRSNPFRCDCSWEEAFFQFEINAIKRGLILGLPDSCVVSKQLRYFGGLPLGTSKLIFKSQPVLQACTRMRLAMDERIRTKRLLLSYLLPLCVVILLLIAASFVYYRHYYSLWLKIDDAVHWQLARRILRLHPQQIRPIDVALFFHESQANEQTQVSNFIHATGKGLVVELVAYHMPGAYVSDQLSSLLTNVSVCILYVTPNFLDDVNYTGPIRDFLESVFTSSVIRLVPIYPDDCSIEQHEDFPVIKRILRRYNGLRWGSSHFWERLAMALPPRRPTTPVRPDLVAAVRNCKLADICIISHMKQLPLVRAFFERYRHDFAIVHCRQGIVYNCPDHLELSSFLQVCMWSRQVVIISPELITEIEDLSRCLRYRLRHFNFPGSVLVVHTETSTVAFNESAAWPALLQDHQDAILHLAAKDLTVENWTDVDNAFGLSQPPQQEAVGEREFRQIFHENGIQVDTSAQEFDQFAANRVLWPVDANSDDQTPLI